MRFVGPDSETSTQTTTSTPVRKAVTDENSFEARGVSPALVLRAQNLVSAEILSEKLLHPPRGVGLGMDDVSHAAVVEEESVRRVSVGGMSRHSLGERSFDVFVDEGGEEEDVLPKELTMPAYRGQWSVPAEGYISEKRLPTASRTKEIEQSEDESEESQEEKPEDELQVKETTARESLHPEEESEEDEFSGSDRVDYDQPETYADDEELSGEDYDEEDDLHHAGYYSQTRSGRQEEEEYYHSEEEEYTDEEEEGDYTDEEEQQVRPKEPQVVDLTLDSSDDEDDEEEPRTTHRQPYPDDDEEMFHSNTPFTDLSHLPSLNQSPQVTQLLDSLLDQPPTQPPL